MLYYSIAFFALRLQRSLFALLASAQRLAAFALSLFCCVGLSDGSYRQSSSSLGYLLWSLFLASKR